jgi:nicotinamidase-related amidase
MDIESAALVVIDLQNGFLNPPLPEPESTDDLEPKSAFAQFSGHFEPLCVFTSQVKIDYRPKSRRLTWGDVDIPP